MSLEATTSSQHLTTPFHDPYTLILFTSLILFTYPFSSTLDPGRATKICLVRFIAWIDSTLALSKASLRLSLIYSPFLPHSHLVYQRAIVLLIWTRAHSLVSLSPHIASPFMPHSYALYPMTHPMLPLCYWPSHLLCDCNVTLGT
jgi:hypothetical protein